MKKCGVIIFHKNIYKIYNKKWINDCLKSVLNQSFQNFTIYEVNYGNEDFSVLEKFDFNQKHNFYKEDYVNHTYAMNYIIDKALQDNCKIIFIRVKFFVSKINCYSSFSFFF